MQGLEELGKVKDDLRTVGEAGISPLLEFLDKPSRESHLIPRHPTQVRSKEWGKVVLVGDGKNPVPGPNPHGSGL